MLFSRKDVSRVINNAFEPVWEMVRPVPIVRVDFGNGNVVTRTLHGNIATYACTADGQVLDVLPGIYAPEQYLQSLSQLRLLAQYVDQDGLDKRAEKLAAYHKLQAENLRKNQPAAQIINAAAISKSAIERSMKLVLMPGHPDAQPTGRADEAVALPTEDLANWRLLAEDTHMNESLRRRQIHEHLATAGAVQPTGTVKWLYKDVLHADLDDPYLGLGSVLFASYPFQKEDKR